MPILRWRTRITCSTAPLRACSPVHADDLTDFNAAVETVSAHSRVAIGYLRTGNVDLASLEMDRLRDAWARFTERFSGKRPEVFADNTLYGKLFTNVSARLVGADIMLKTGRLDAARSALDAVRGDLYDLRKQSGVVVLGDCVRDANRMMDALMAYDDRTLDWGSAEIRSGVAAKASSYGSLLDRCTGIASEAVRTA